MFYLNEDLRILRLLCIGLITSNFGIMGFLIGGERKNITPVKLPSWVLTAAVKTLYCAGLFTAGALAWFRPTQPLAALALGVVTLSMLTTGIAHGAWDAIRDLSPDPATADTMLRTADHNH
jgi:hypothetical protein